MRAGGRRPLELRRARGLDTRQTKTARSKKFERKGKTKKIALRAGGRRPLGALGLRRERGLDSRQTKTAKSKKFERKGKTKRIALRAGGRGIRREREESIQAWERYGIQRK